MTGKVSIKRVRRDDERAQAELRDAAVAAALALYRQHGLAGLTMRAVADAVAVSPMALYRYFANKAELLAAMGEFAIRELMQAMQPTSARPVSPQERVRATTAAFIDYWQNHPDHYRLVYIEAVGNADDARRLGGSPVYQQLLQSGTALFEALADAVGADHSRVALARDLRLSMMLGYLQASLVIRRYPWSDLAALRECLVERALQAAIECLHGR
jgi:AcrR family transcriptional regulator